MSQVGQPLTFLQKCREEPENLEQAEHRVPQRRQKGCAGHQGTAHARGGGSGEQLHVVLWCVRTTYMYSAAVLPPGTLHTALHCGPLCYPRLCCVVHCTILHWCSTTLHTPHTLH